MKKYLIGFLFLLIFTACSSDQTKEISLLTPSATFHLTNTASQTLQPKETMTPSLAITDKDQQTSTVTLTPSPTTKPTRSPEPTLTPSQTRPTIPAVTLQAKATLEVLEDSCEVYETDSSRYSEISPDGEWFAISCGYKRNQKLLVQNQAGVKWVFDFADFITPDLEGIMGSLEPLAWSLDGRFLYFTKYLGRSGGGNQCFPGFGVYGLYRLHLHNGTLVTIVPTQNWFPGDEIKFSPTMEYYATDVSGVTISNLETGEITKISASGVMNMLWSPDGRYLAFSTAVCGEFAAQTSTVYLWDAATTQTQVLFTEEGSLLTPKSWKNATTLEVEGEKFVDPEWEYTVYEYDVAKDDMLFWGTVTPRP